MLISAERIALRVSVLGRRIAEDAVGDSPLLVVAVLTGAVFFCVDLMRAMAGTDVELEFVRASSYGSKRESSGEIELSALLPRSLAGRRVLVVEDILDTGHTLARVHEELKLKGAEWVKTAVLLAKPTRVMQPDYVGFDIDNRFVVGYGLDDAGRWRNLPYVGLMENEI